MNGIIIVNVRLDFLPCQKKKITFQIIKRACYIERSGGKTIRWGVIRKTLGTFDVDV